MRKLFNLKKIVKLLILLLLFLFLYFSFTDDNLKLVNIYKKHMLEKNFDLPQLKYRRELGTLMESMNAKTMVEVKIKTSFSFLTCYT